MARQISDLARGFCVRLGGLMRVVIVVLVFALKAGVHQLEKMGGLRGDELIAQHYNAVIALREILV